MPASALVPGETYAFEVELESPVINARDQRQILDGQAPAFDSVVAMVSSGSLLAARIEPLSLYGSLSAVNRAAPVSYELSCYGRGERDAHEHELTDGGRRTF